VALHLDRASTSGGRNDEDVVAGSELVFPMRRLTADGLVAWQQVVERGYEGYVAKDEASTYEGGVTRRWVKVKQKNWTIGDERWTRRISVAPGGWPSSGTAR
jgi:ATP-dependent DNA ligase